MLDYKNKTLNGKLIYPLVASVIVITPWTSYDPINLSKFVVLNLLAWPILINLFFARKSLFHQGHTKLILVSFSFILWSLFSTLFSDINVVDRLIGSNGKHMGLVSYFLLFTILIASSANENFSYAKILNLIVFAGLLSGLYGLIQHSGKDPIDWVNTSGLVFSFFGNPNFHSAFMSISFLATFALLLSLEKLKFITFIYLLNLLSALFNLYISNSSQGFIILFVGLVIFLIAWVYRSKPSLFNRLLVLILSTATAIMAVLDIFQKSPLKSFLYENSVSYRGDYWRSGWGMLQANPLFGVGFDGFKDNYRLFRDLKSIERGISGNVDSPHNIFLDIGTSGGFPLLFIFIALNLLILFSIFRIIVRYKTNDYLIIGVIACWIGFTLQSLISVPRISLAIIGYIFGGLIIGYDVNKDKIKLETVRLKSNDFKTGTTFLALILGMAISLPSFANDIRFRNALNDGNVEVIKQTLSQWPQSYEHILFTSSLLGQAGLSKESLEFSYLSVKYNQNCFECWESIVTNEVSLESEKLIAIKNMSKLEPENLKLYQVSRQLGQKDNLAR
jgi:O-antigen ligase